jgi:hypothetical protein
MLKKESAAQRAQTAMRLDGIERAVQRHKGLTLAEAQEIADEFGF